MNKDSLIKRLWQMWEDLAEAGEIRIGKGFSKKYDEIKKEVDKQLQSHPQEHKSAEEILGKYVHKYMDDREVVTSYKIVHYDSALKAMHEYAQQGIELPSDEEIKRNIAYTLFDINKRYKYTFEDTETEQLIIISEDTERKAFKKAFRMFELLRDRELRLISSEDTANGSNNKLDD